MPVPLAFFIVPYIVNPDELLGEHGFSFCKISRLRITSMKMRQYNVYESMFDMGGIYR